MPPMLSHFQATIRPTTIASIVAKSRLTASGWARGLGTPSPTAKAATRSRTKEPRMRAV